MTNWKNKKVSVFGLGKSGLAAVKRLSDLGADIFVSESSSLEKLDPDAVSEIKRLGAKLETSKHSAKAIERPELIVVSPGVDHLIPILQEAARKNIPIISEIELASQFLSKPIIAVTGTNGKTTTATLIGEFLKAAGNKTAVTGNIGTPLVSIDDKNLDYIVLEISSYQLETIVNFKPWISLILNLTEDHLLRHKTMENYADSKARIFKNQTERDYLIYNAEDPLVSKIVKKAKARLVPFKIDGFQAVLGASRDEIQIKGDHNLENAVAAAHAAKIAGVSTPVIATVLRSFKGVEHRIEFVREKDGVKFYNDSKATNPDSTIVALKALDAGKRNILLLLGGRDKNTDLGGMCKLIKNTAKKVILLGEAAGRFENALRENGFDDIILAANFESAVFESFKLASKGDIILLSPACASFDMFKNFEERGQVFKSLVNKL